jgi:hypothetical protein
MNLPYYEIDFSDTQCETLEEYEAYKQKYLKRNEPEKKDPDFTRGWYFGGLYWD